MTIGSINIRKWLFWIVLVGLIFVTRFFLLVKFPPHLTIDEVAIGYNAYSILKTGRDEWGQFLPTSFRSVGDYKPPILIYLTVPFVWIFGLTELTTRLPVALFSAFGIISVFIFLKYYLLKKSAGSLAYLATIVLTLSPWHIIYSRSGFEAILAFCFMILNFIFLFRYQRSRRYLDFFIAVLFAYLSAITYHSTKLLVPVLNLSFLIIHSKQFITDFKLWLRSGRTFYLLGILTLLLTVFFVSNYIFGPGSERAKMTFLAQDFDYARVLLPKLIDSPLSFITTKVALVLFWFKRYLEYFSLNFYVSTGLNLVTTGQYGQGVIYLIELPLLIVGLLSVFKNSTKLNLFAGEKKTLIFLSVWFLFGFFPASLTNNSQHSLRSINVLPVVVVLISVGLWVLWKAIAKKQILVKVSLLVIILGGYSLGILRFVDYFTLHYPVQLSEYRQFGWKEMAIFGSEHAGEYDHVYVDHRFGSAGPYTYGVPYAYFLFYSKYDPAKYQADPRRAQFNSNYENFIFTEINWPEIDHSQNNLYIASPWSFPKEIINSDKVLFKTDFLNGTTGLYAAHD